MKIAIMGTGYVGLVSGAGFSELGHNVTCVDIDEKKINALNDGVIPIYEPGLEDLVKRNKSAGRIEFTTDVSTAIKNNDVILIAVGTPSDVDGRADLKYVLQVAKDIGQNMNNYKLVITKSTVPVGSGYKVKAQILEELNTRGENISFDIASNPEFLKEGAAIEDFMRPDRIVAGVETDKAKEWIEDLYAPFIKNGHPLYFMDIASSEMTKYAANSLLATKISFMNEVARLCEKMGANVDNVRKGIGSDKRIGFPFLYAGVGYGGSCFPKDVNALIRSGEENNTELEILKSVVGVNASQRVWFIDKILTKYAQGIKGKTFGVWGLSFKPGTDDMREAPSIEVIAALLKHGAKVQVYDPIATKNAQSIIPDHKDLTYCSSSKDSVSNCDALVILTEWKEFHEPDFDSLLSEIKDKVIFDGRNLYTPKKMSQRGFDYVSIGRPI